MKIHRRTGEIRQEVFTYKTLSGNYTLSAIVHYPREWRPTDKRPVFVCSYGSGWKGGKYEADPLNDTYLARWEPKCDDMALKGIVSIRYDYRAPGKVEDFSDPKIAMISDARSVVRWIRKNADKLGVDTGRICGAGGSSGFHIMASGTVLEGTTYNQPEELPDISPKANVLIGFTGALCKSSGDMNGLCPGDFIQAGGPPFLGIVGEKDSWRTGVERYVKNAYKLHTPSLLKLAPGQGHDFHVGLFGKGTPEWYDTTMRWAQDFLFSIGHMDLTVICQPGENVSLNTLSQFIRGYCSLVDTLGQSGDILYQYSGKGGNVDANGIFTSNGLPGLFKVTAQSKKYPYLSRHAIVRVPVMLTSNTAFSTVTADGFYGVYAKVKERSDKDAEFTVRHQGGESRVTVSTKSLEGGFYYIGAFQFESNSTGGITVAENGGGSIDSIMLVSAYSGNRESELTSTNSQKRFKPSGLMRSIHSDADLYSLNGKKIDIRTLHSQSYMNEWSRGIYIVRIKEKGNNVTYDNVLFLDFKRGFR